MSRKFVYALCAALALSGLAAVTGCGDTQPRNYQTKTAMPSPTDPNHGQHVTNPAILEMIKERGGLH